MATAPCLGWLRGPPSPAASLQGHHVPPAATTEVVFGTAQGLQRHQAPQDREQGRRPAGGRVGGGWVQVPYLPGSQRRGRGGSRRHAALHAGSAGAGVAPHTAAAGASPCAAACRGVRHRSRASHTTQPCWPQGHNAPNLTCCCPPAESAAHLGAAGHFLGARRAPLPASAAPHASGPVLLQPPVPGSRQPGAPPAPAPALGMESMEVSLPPHSASALWHSDPGRWWPGPTLGEVVTLEPQGPVVLAQSLVLPAQLQPWLQPLGVGIAGQSCKGGTGAESLS